MELDFFSLECNALSGSEFWGVYGFGMIWGSLSFNVQFVFLFCSRISVVYLALGLDSSWMELDFSGSDGKASVYNVGDPGSIPGSGRPPGEGNGNPLQYYCLEDPMDRGAW